VKRINMILNILKGNSNVIERGVYHYSFLVKLGWGKHIY